MNNVGRWDLRLCELEGEGSCLAGLVLSDDPFLILLWFSLIFFGIFVYSYGRRDLLNRVYASDGNRLDAIQRAEDLEAGLDNQFPSFIKPMLQSHVTGGFWLVNS